MRLFKSFDVFFEFSIFYFYPIIFLFEWSHFCISNCSGELIFANGNNITRTRATFREMVQFQSRYNSKQIRYFPGANKRNEHKIRNVIRKSLYFMYYKNGKMLLKSSLETELSGPHYSLLTSSCVNEKITLIFHGWTESCTTEWVPQLQERLTFYRGGCIICVDYSSWSKKSYFELLQKFDILTEILYENIFQLITIGFSPSKIFMFGFSYGGQIASKIGRLLRPHYKINKIDICDIAGPGFDFLTHLNHSEAAENVQCYSSSLDKGSHFLTCHQNIRFGLCGYTQPAILSQPYFSSHGLCVRIYINAFDFPFYAIKRTAEWCERGKTIYDLPKGFTIGYKEGDYRHMEGDIFVPTSLNYPYNLSKRDILLYEKYLENA